MVVILSEVPHGSRAVRQHCLKGQTHWRVPSLRRHEGRLRIREIEFSLALAGGTLHDLGYTTPTYDLKKDMEWLFEARLRDGRLDQDIKGDIYALSPLVCPFCQIDSPTTLEHMIPKASDPLLAVDPRNLAPCCAPCNNKRRNGDGRSSINLYVDSWAATATWLTARLVDPGDPESLTFAVASDLPVTEQQAALLKTHFKERGIADRAKTKALHHLVSFRTNLRLGWKFADLPLSAADDWIRSEARRLLEQERMGRAEDFGPNYWLVAAADCWLANVSSIRWSDEALTR